MPSPGSLVRLNGRVAVVVRATPTGDGDLVRFLGEAQAEPCPAWAVSEVLWDSDDSRETGTAVLVLDAYEASNLREALRATGYGEPFHRSPLSVLHSGDWVGQVWQKVPDTGHPPNATAAEYAERARSWS
jgi:hypothetical protein